MQTAGQSRWSGPQKLSVMASHKAQGQTSISWRALRGLWARRGLTLSIVRLLLGLQRPDAQQRMHHLHQALAQLFSRRSLAPLGAESELVQAHDLRRGQIKAPDNGVIPSKNLRWVAASEPFKVAVLTPALRQHA